MGAEVYLYKLSILDNHRASRLESRVLSRPAISPGEGDSPAESRLIRDESRVCPQIFSPSLSNVAGVVGK